MLKQIKELEKLIGHPSELVIDDKKLFLLKQWVKFQGCDSETIDFMSVSHLVNLYHELYGKESAQSIRLQPDVADLTSEIFVKIIETIGVKGWDQNVLRQFAQDELQKYTGNSSFIDAVTKISNDVYNALPVKRLEVATQNATVIIEGAKHYKTEQIIKVAMMKQPVMLIGPAGCGKTTIAENVATALNLPFYVTNSISDAFQLTGFIDGYGKYHTTSFRTAFEHGGVWLADEIDSWDAGALLAANSALANGYSTFPDQNNPIRKHENFRVIASANTYGNGSDQIYVGRTELDGASLDRFAMISLDYDLTLERMFANGQDKWLAHVWKIRKQCADKKIRHIVSSRAIIMGANALINGLTFSECENMYIFKGMSQNDREKLK